MGRKNYAIGGVLVLTAIAGGIMAAVPFAQSSQGGAMEVAAVAAGPLFVAAPGRIEGAFDTVEVGTAATGIIAEILAREGQIVRRGDILARLECRDIDAELLIRRAEAASLEAQLALSIAGPRIEEIGAASADVHLAEARLNEAQLSVGRNALLLKQAATSRERFDEVQRDARIAEAQLDSANQHLRQLEAGSRPEEIGMLRARVSAANAAILQTSARLDRCSVLSPVDGTILRKNVSAGELVSMTMPHPLFSITDLTRTRVRVEVDERDVGRLKTGQLAEVRLPWNKDGGPLSGVVVSLSPKMGRRQVLTGDPAEKSDHDVQEVIVDLAVNRKYVPIGLRVSVFFYALDDAHLRLPVRQP